MAIIGSNARIRLYGVDFSSGTIPYGPTLLLSANRNCYPVKIDNIIWVTNITLGTITPFNISVDPPVANTAVAFSLIPTGVTFDGRFAWCGLSAGTVRRHDLVSGTQMESFAIASGFQGMTFDGLDIWANNPVSGNIERYDTRTGVLKYSFTAPANTMDLHHDGRNLYILTGIALTTGTIKKYDPITGTEEASINLDAYASTETALGITGDFINEDDDYEEGETRLLWVIDKHDVAA